MQRSSVTRDTQTQHARYITPVVNHRQWAAGSHSPKPEQGKGGASWVVIGMSRREARRGSCVGRWVAGMGGGEEADPVRSSFPAAPRPYHLRDDFPVSARVSSCQVSRWRDCSDTNKGYGAALSYDSINATIFLPKCTVTEPAACWRCHTKLSLNFAKEKQNRWQEFSKCKTEETVEGH